MISSLFVFPSLLHLHFCFTFQNGPPDLVSTKAIANCWGALIKAFVNGWDYNECERMFRNVSQFGAKDEVGAAVNQFLGSEPGTLWSYYILFHTERFRF